MALSDLDLGGIAASCPWPDSSPRELGRLLAKSTAPLREAPLTHEIVLLAQQLSLAHRDPADRFLAATAQLLNLTLVTGDERLLGLGTIRTMKN